MVLYNKLNIQHSYPLTITIYKDKDQMILVPTINHIYGYSIAACWGILIKQPFVNEDIGRGVREALNYIENAPFSKLTPKEREEQAAWKKLTNYSTINVFWKNVTVVEVYIKLSGEISICAYRKGKTYRSEFGECIRSEDLPAESTETEIGNVIADVIKTTEEYYQCISKRNLYPPKDLTLLDESKLTITPPKNSHFEDTGDMGAMECYQSYSYIPKEGDEASAIFYLTIAPEIDCDLSTDNVRACWEETYGAADMFEMKEESKGIYTHQAIMKNKEQYRKSYFLQMEEDLILECGMTVYMPNRRKKLCEKMETLFEEFAAGCKFTS